MTFNKFFIMNFAIEIINNNSISKKLIKIAILFHCMTFLVIAEWYANFVALWSAQFLKNLKESHITSITTHKTSFSDPHTKAVGL